MDNLRKGYPDGDTFWIVNEALCTAYECDNKIDTITPPAPDEVFICHNMSERHGASILDLKDNGQKPIPARFWDMNI